jgi:hypothetical protein
MSVFISYKGEDAARVAPLARALQSSGFNVWWDRYLPGGENWQAQIQAALAGAKCVIVAWSQTSVGPSGDFVRDEARNGKQRGILVPIKLDRVAPPLGFGEIQVIDLTTWKGKTSDPFFQDLVAAVKAKIEGRPVPAAKAPLKRLQQRLTYGTALSMFAAAIGAFGSNTFHLQDKTCASSPFVSDLCGGLGLGGRPTKTERLAWQSLRPGNCDDLRNFLGRFPTGAYSTQAHSLLADRHVIESPVWTAVTHQLALRESPFDIAKATLAQAKTDAVTRAQSKAVNLCNGFAATTRFRFKSAGVEAQQWDCGKNGAGFSCGFDGQAICELEESSVRADESCGK